MMLGLGLSLCSQSAGAAVFDPATLSLTGWWRAPFSASPWVGVASAGASGSRNLTEASDPPTAGTATSAGASADFNGTTSRITAPGTMSDYVGASAGSSWALVWIDAIDTDAAVGASYNNDAIWTDSLAFIGLYLRQTGPVMHGFFFDSGNADKTVVGSISTGAWALLQMRWDNTNVSVRMNGGAWVDRTNGTGAISAAFGAAQMRIGRSYNNTKFLDGRLAELAFADSTLDDDTFTNILSYARAFHGVPLL